MPDAVVTIHSTNCENIAIDESAETNSKTVFSNIPPHMTCVCVYRSVLVFITVPTCRHTSRQLVRTSL